jgi:hypothetical protein
VSEHTVVDFGRGDALEIKLGLDEAAAVIERALGRRTLVEVADATGKRVVFNPMQVKILRPGRLPDEAAALDEDGMEVG